MEGRSKRVIFTSIFTASLAILAVFAYTAFASQPVRWGPIKCDSCASLQMPYPDGQTQAVLDKFVEDPYPDVLDIFTRQVEPNDVVTVCTNTVCVDYRMNFSRKFEGIESRPIQTVGGGGGGGGMEGGGPGGGFGGDECSVVPKTGSACVGVNGVNHCQTIDSSYIDCGFGA